MIHDLKPMLAASIRSDKNESIAGLRFPLIASPKIDGIRCLINGKPLSRSLKPIPNAHVSRMLDSDLLRYLDGELLVGDGDNFQQVTSGIMSRDGTPDFTFHVFDHFAEPNAPYERRPQLLHSAFIAARRRHPFLRFVETQMMFSLADLEDFAEKCLSEGYEGAMVRTPHGPYKFGRSTFKEGYLVKIKPFEDDEAEIVGFEEQMENRNEATTNELGRTKRSSHMANLVPKGTLGALIVRNKKFGEFNIGTGVGLNDALKAEIWKNRNAYLGKTIKFRYQAAGPKDKPRIPSFQGFRHPDDL